MALTAEPVTGKSFSFARLRQLLEDQGGGLQEGVVGAGDFKVTQRAAGGAAMFVDVAPGQAWVEIDSGVRQGLAHVTNDAVATLAVNPSHATLPRISFVVLQYNDTAIPAGVGGDVPTLRVIDGVPTGGITLDAPGAGLPAMPNDALLLDAFLVPAASTSVTNANMRDRRKWARGASFILQRTAGNLTTTATTPGAVSTTDFQRRFEFGANPVKARLLGRGSHANVNQWAGLSLRDNAVAVGPFAVDQVGSAGGNFGPVLYENDWISAAGSHLLEPYWRSSDGGVVTLYAVPTSEAGIVGPLVWSVQEDVRPSADNT